MHKNRKLGFVLAPFPVIAGVLVLILALGAFRAPGVTHAAAAASGSPSVAHSVPLISVVGAHKGPHGQLNSTSSNWSGYATTGTTYSTVAGSWTQPTATCSRRQTAYAAFWVGIDGDGTNSVEQTGTDSDCSRGTPKYYAWYEMYPAYPVNLSYTVRPGDSLSASVTFNGGSSFTLKISDSTQNWSYSTNQSLSGAARGSAEWIAEAPSSSSGVLPLANFGTVYFSSCTANGNPISSNPNVDEIVMETSGGTVKAQPSGISGGNAFSDTWHHS